MLQTNAFPHSPSFLAVAVLEARKLKKMDITGASDPYVKIKLFDNKVRREKEGVVINSVYAIV